MNDIHMVFKLLFKRIFIAAQMAHKFLNSGMLHQMSSQIVSGCKTLSAVRTLISVVTQWKSLYRLQSWVIKISRLKSHIILVALMNNLQIMLTVRRLVQLLIWLMDDQTSWKQFLWLQQSKTTSQTDDKTKPDWRHNDTPKVKPWQSPWSTRGKSQAALLKYQIYKYSL